MTDRRFTLDTNVLVCSIDSNSIERHAKAEQIVSRSLGTDCVLTLQSLGEFYRVAVAKRRMERAVAAQAIEDWTQAFEIVAADKGSLREAIVAEALHGLSFWDAMLWATAKAAGCRLIVTEDFQAGREVDGVLFVNPFGTVDMPPELERVLAPR